MLTTTVRKAPHAPPGCSGPQSRAARVASAKPPAAAKAKATAEAAARRRSRLQDDVAEALGAPPPPRAKRVALSTRDSTPTKVSATSASGSAKRSSTKVAPAPTKAAGAREQTARALKSPVALPEPRHAPPKVVIRFPKLPVQAHAARYQDAREQQTNLTRYRRFLAAAKMVGEARRLTADEKHQVDCARARIEEIKSAAWSSVR